MRTKEQAERESREHYFLTKCPNCGEELVVARSELDIKLFEPVEKEYEYWQGGFTDEHNKKGKRMVSSDSSKDIYTGFKCPKCGHEWEEPVVPMYEKRCNQDGRNTMVFELNDVESERAREFIKKHDHSKELIKEKGSPFFSAMGHQFKYTIIPGGLGPIVHIECNYCHESEELTDSENW